MNERKSQKMAGAGCIKRLCCLQKFNIVVFFFFLSVWNPASDIADGN